MEEENGKASQFQFLWGWGASTDGQLGTGTLQDQLLPQPLPLTTTLLHHSDDEDSSSSSSSSSSSTTITLQSPPASVDPPPLLPISHLACGGAHTIALTSNGRVLTWGRGTQGQLGHGLPKSCAKPRNLKILENCTVSFVSAGWNHSGFVTDDGCLLTCGDGSFGQLGHGDYQSQFSPTEVSFFVSKHVKQIACGMRHSLVLLKGPSRKSVYGFGSGRHGQLGISLNGTKKLFSLPQIILVFEEEMIGGIHANGDHSAALSIYGQLYIWGRAFYGKLNDYLPLKLPLHLTFTQVVLGWNHALLLTDEGELYMIGGNLHGKLSALEQVKSELAATVPSSKHATPDEKASMSYSFERIPGMDGGKVVHIAAGSEHSVLVTESGKIMTWGWGEHGQLGLGNVLDQTMPQVVDIGWTGFNDPTKIKVYCGCGFTFALKSVG